jgi:UPF0716 protein FxsA
MRRSVIIVGLLVIFAVIEIALLIAVGRVIGAGWTLLLVLATSALGGWLLRREGSRAWKLFRADLEAERPPGRAATEGLLVLVGGIFMVVPGFISDVIGALLLTPPTRRVARAGLLHLFGGRMSPRTATVLFGPRHVRVRTGTPRPSDEPPTTPSTPSTPTLPGPAIEGEIIDPR